jgi:hypothetical protein
MNSSASALLSKKKDRPKFRLALVYLSTSKDDTSSVWAPEHVFNQMQLLVVMK